MEFERDKPASAEDIALADAPKVVLQPFSAEVNAESTNSNYTHQNEASFKFETESTETSTPVQQPTAKPNKTAILLISMACVTVIVVTLLLVYYFQ